MADSKANDLVKRVFSSLADLTGVRIWTQKDGETDALGLEASELLSSSSALGSTNDYQALTPKGFAASIANTDNEGIVKRATDADIESAVADVVTDAKQLKNRYDQAIGISNIKLRLVAIVSSSGSPTKILGDLDITATKLATGSYGVTHNLGNNNYFIIPSTRRSDTTTNYIQPAGQYKGFNYFKIDFADSSSAKDTDFEFQLFEYINV